MHTSQPNYDSNFCGSLPIHLINTIQSYGALLVVEQKTLRITQVSENIQEIFDVPASDMVEKDLHYFLQPQDMTLLKERITEASNNSFPLFWNIHGKNYLILLHLNDPYFLIEIDEVGVEKMRQDTFVGVYQHIKYAMARIEAASSIAELASIAAKELKRISGFDKVMIYQFDEEWNGKVIAEEKEERMEAYLGFTFPASDIPAQARKLYLKNAYRYIPDRDYKPVKLYPVINPLTNAFLDLSDCNLRGVAAVHVEYLKSMNVVASMSTRIMIDDRLWGLISCHHRTKKNMSYQDCSMFEMLSSIISSKISSLHNKEILEFDTVLRERYTRMLEEALRSETIADGLLNTTSDVMTLFQAQGVIVTYRGKIYTKGDVPEKEKIEEMMLWLHTKELKSIFATDSFSSLYDSASTYKDLASGILVIPINAKDDEYVVLLRGERVREINWGGNPDERIQFESDGKNYHPRNSFKQWKQKISGVSDTWKIEELETAESLRSFIYEFTN
jgi:light-regulated signal transduction histidine kinase (bacteriophytochrome)